MNFSAAFFQTCSRISLLIYDLVITAAAATDADADACVYV